MRMQPLYSYIRGIRIALGPGESQRGQFAIRLTLASALHESVPAGLKGPLYQAPRHIPE